MTLAWGMGEEDSVGAVLPLSFLLAISQGEVGRGLEGGGGQRCLAASAWQDWMGGGSLPRSAEEL